MDDQHTEGPSDVRHSSADYMRFHKPEKKSPFRKLRKLFIFLVAVAVLAAAAYGTYAFIINRQQKPAPATQNSQQTTTPKPKQPAIVTETKHHESEIFDLGIDYPATWSIIETPNTNRFVIHSEPTDLTAATGKQQTGKIVLTVNLSGQNLSMFDSGNAVAVRDSKKISYSKPTSMQRGETYLSFLQYPATNIEDGLDGIYITGDFGYLEGQAIPKIDVAKANPLVTVTFLACADKACGGSPTPLSIANSMWDKAEFATPIEAMLRSITIN